MAWVGLTFYALHFPLILTAIWSGRKLLSAAVATATAMAAAGLAEPLLSPQTTDDKERGTGGRDPWSHLPRQPRPEAGAEGPRRATEPAGMPDLPVPSFPILVTPRTSME